MPEIASPILHATQSLYSSFCAKAVVEAETGEIIRQRVRIAFMTIVAPPFRKCPPHLPPYRLDLCDAEHKPPVTAVTKMPIVDSNGA
jgi:hypothetical protein